ncbi:MAG: rane protein [Herbaspirillum sp.]|nr:rane protein [Herbaspirillum sp.]
MILNRLIAYCRQGRRAWRHSLPGGIAALFAAAIFAALALPGPAAYAGYNVWTSDYTFSARELQTAIQTRFPRDLRYMDLFNVRLSNPQLTLDPAGNRIVTKLDAGVTSLLLAAAPVNGVLTIDSGLKYDAATRTVRLDRPELKQIEVPGMPAAYAQQMRDIGNTVAVQVLDNYPLYTFKPEELQLNGQRFEPGAITVTDAGLKVEIRPL